MLLSPPKINESRELSRVVFPRSTPRQVHLLRIHAKRGFC
jgi:hypothetical protein